MLMETDDDDEGDGDGYTFEISLSSFNFSTQARVPATVSFLQQFAATTISFNQSQRKTKWGTYSKWPSLMILAAVLSPLAKVSMPAMCPMNCTMVSKNEAKNGDV